MRLPHKDLVEISDFEIPRFGSLFCFLIQSFTPSDDIHRAARDGDVPALRHFLRVDPERVHKKGIFGRRPQRMAKLLVPLVLRVEGSTPLHLAAGNGRVAAAELLLSKGAAVDAKNDTGKTPLDRAREEGETEMVQFLLNWPADKASKEVKKAD
eukprot:symbB.v1.2.026845.t1/scaffold2588.1/size75582/8